MQDGISELQHIEKKSLVFPNKKTMFSAAQAAGDTGSFLSCPLKIAVTAFFLRQYHDHCYTYFVFSFLSNYTSQCDSVIIFILHRHVSSLFPFTYVVLLNAEKTPQPDRAPFFFFLSTPNSIQL